MSTLTRDSFAASTHNNLLTGAVSVDDDAAAFGEFLRRARERRGLSLQQIAEETKIPRRHLVSLEHGDLSVIPGSTYRRGEVVAYAKAVGLDSAVALAELVRVSQAPASDTSVTQTSSNSQRRYVGVALVSTAVLLGALTVGVVVSKQASGEVSNASSSPIENHSAGPAQRPATASNPDATNAASAEIRSTSQPSADVAHATLDVPAPSAGGAGPSSPVATPPSDVATPPSDVATASSRPLASVPVREPGSAVPGKDAMSNGEPAQSTPNSDETSLAIISEPAGARVTVNEIGWGTTPVTIRNLPAGTKQIRVTKDGYTAAVRVAKVVEGRASTLRIPLRSTSTPAKTP